ncbi:MAG: hypothetical protein K0R08_1904 [Solimicrobium sp.]|nr:hypothetical protein [Solimicrobium sp.]
MRLAYPNAAGMPELKRASHRIVLFDGLLLSYFGAAILEAAASQP